MMGKTIENLRKHIYPCACGQAKTREECLVSVTVENYETQTPQDPEKKACAWITSEAALKKLKRDPKGTCFARAAAEGAQELKPLIDFDICLEVEQFHEHGSILN